MEIMLSLDQQNKWREQYRQMHPGWQPATEVYALLVRQQLQSSARLLDIGCGRGGLVEQLNHPLRQMAGIDPDWHSLSEHRLALPRAAAHSDALPFAARCFEVVCASWVLEHLAQPARTFAAIGRILTPGGTFVFITPNGRHPLTLLNRGIGRWGQLQGSLVDRLYGRAAADAFPTYYRANVAATLADLCQENGMTLHTLHTIPDPTYLAFHPLLFRLACRLEAFLPPSRYLHLVGMAICA